MPPSIPSTSPDSGKKKREEESRMHESSQKKRKEETDDEPNIEEQDTQSLGSSFFLIPLQPTPHPFSNTERDGSALSPPPQAIASIYPERSMSQIAMLNEQGRQFFRASPSEGNKPILTTYWNTPISREIQNVILDTLNQAPARNKKYIENTRYSENKTNKDFLSTTRKSQLAKINTLLNMLSEEFPSGSVVTFAAKSQETVSVIDMKDSKQASAIDGLFTLINFSPVTIKRARAESIIEFTPPIPLSTLVQKLFALAIYLKCEVRSDNELDGIISNLKQNAPISPLPDTQSQNQNPQQGLYLPRLTLSDSPPPLVHASVLSSSGFYPTSSTPNDPLGYAFSKAAPAPSFLDTENQNPLQNSFPNNGAPPATPPDQQTNPVKEREVLEFLIALNNQNAPGPSTLVTSSHINTQRLMGDLGRA